MTSEQAGRARASSDRTQSLTVSNTQRPSMGSRTSSAPADGSPKPDLGRKTGLEHTLVEEEERAGTGEAASSTLTRRNFDGTSSKTGFPEVTIAVVGEENAGKSSFIRRALDMKNNIPTSTLNKKKMSLDGSVYMVQLLEIDLKEVRFDTDNQIIWPRSRNGTLPPRIDGALALHDATDPERLSEMTGLLDSLAASTLPFLLVACKCDLRPEDSGLDAVHNQYEIYRTSYDSPRSQRMCIALVLRAIISHRDDRTSASSHPNPPASSSNATRPFQHNSPPSSPSPHDWHHRFNPENPTVVFSGAAGGPNSTVLDRTVDEDGDLRRPSDRTNTSSLAYQHAPSSSRYTRSNSQPMRPQTPPAGAVVNPRRPSVPAESSPARDHNRQQRLHTAWRHSGGSDAFNSFLNMEDEMEDGQSPTSPGSVVRAKPSSESNSSAESGVSFDELIDRLVAMPMSKQDSKFASIFLCLYRKFTAPGTLLDALIERFESNETNITDQLARVADQQRLLNILAQWASEYPGDFAHTKTRKLITDFVVTLEKSHFYMFAAKEIGSYLDTNAEDDDVGWAFRDGNAEEPNLTETFFVNSGRSSPVPFLTATYDEDEEEEDPIYSMSALDLSDGPHDSTSRLSGTLSLSPTAEKPCSTQNQSFTFLSLEAAQKEALRLELTSRIPLTKFQWRYFMETPEEDFARELTRIDWIMYNSFRPRDLVRHVSLSGVEKDKVPSLKNVNRMIKQFNHLAFFVASMILLRDKPKHRASALEKFMNIAVKLRRQNNYNSLGAVIAAINGTPVHRLAQTRELVPVQTQKEFMRLIILMGTQRSHFAYRLAWENSFSERIPFLPLHRRDLVSAEEGNKTFVGENRSRINWKKFEVMGEVVLGIQRSQKSPHPQAHKIEDIERLILDTKLSGDEEDLYGRSLQVEPSTGVETGRRKFGWLRSYA